MWRWTREQPPSSIVLKNRRISMWAGDEVFDQGPFVREGRCPIQTHCVGSKSFRSHIKIIFPSEDVRVRKMKRLLQDDSFVVPVKTIAAGGAADVALVGPIIQDLEKHVPQAVDVDHEWI